MVSKLPGSAWIEGNYFHFVAANGQEWRFLGDYISNPSGPVGAMWVELQHTHYITESGTERRMPGVYISNQSGVARKGSVWIDNENHTDTDGGHYDTPHYDKSDPHGDVTHIDTATTTWSEGASLCNVKLSVWSSG